MNECSLCFILKITHLTITLMTCFMRQVIQTALGLKKLLAHIPCTCLQGQFREDNFATAMAVLANAGEAAKGDTFGRRGGPTSGKETNAFKIVKMIMERNYAPVICFSFSKKDCENYALQMSKLDFNTCKCLLRKLH